MNLHGSGSDKAAPFGTGPGAWPVRGAIYEVCPENFPQHSVNEITDRIPVMERLGVTVIYLTPIFTHTGEAQYLIIDYYHLDPRYGTAADLQRLVKVAHQHGIKVLLDFVTSLTYDGSYIMTQHPEWILRGKDGKMQRYYPFPEWGWAIDCANPGLIDYYTKVARYYLEKFDTDGWRVDSPMNNYDPAKVDGEHNRMELFRSVKTAVTSVKKDAIFVAEIPGPEVMWGKDDNKAQTLFDEMFEASYNYDYCGFLGGDRKSGGYYMYYGSPGLAPLQPTELNRIAHNQATSKDVVESFMNRKVLYGRLRANFIENHDTARVSVCFPDQHRALFVLVATLPGIPVIHAGQEIGSTVHPSVSGGNPVVDWKGGDADLEGFYKQVMRVRGANPALYEGELKDIWKSGDHVIAFLRSAGNNRVVVALNFDSKPAHATIGAPAAELGLQPKRSYALHDELSGESKTYQGKQLEEFEVNLPPYGYKILSIQRP
jgi:glycosidase